MRVLQWTAERFTRAQIASPRLDAEVLLAHVLGTSRIRLYMDFDKPLAAAELGRYREAVRRRLGGEPVSYITGERELYSLAFTVNRHVLVPRPETELLVDVALNLAREDAARPGAALPLTIADVGTGSGAIAVVLARQLGPAVARLLAIDRSQQALEVAAHNARRHGAELELLEGDLLDPVPEAERLRLVVSNPPYVPSTAFAGLAREVRDFEPRLALDGGPDGLDVIRRLVRQAATRIEPAGAIALEIGAGQRAAVVALLEEAGFVAPRAERDLAGIERVVTARRPPL